MHPRRARLAAALTLACAIVAGPLVAPVSTTPAQAAATICASMGTNVTALTDSSMTLEAGTVRFPREYELDGVVRRSTGEPVVFNGLAAGEHRVVSRIYEGERLFATSDVPVLVGPSRVHGPDRYTTAASVSAVARGTDCTPTTAYIVNGESYADALAAVPVAGNSRGILLLATRDDLTAATEERLVASGVSRVRLIGGPARLASTLCDDARALGIQNCSRIAGPDRYAMSMAVASEIGPIDSNPYYFDHVVIVTGEKFPDAVSAGPYAASQGAPIILVPGSRPRLPDSIGQFLGRVQGTITIVGGTASVSAGIEAQLREDIRVPIRRFDGADRYATNAALNDYILTFSPTPRVYAKVATGRNFPDALYGSMLAVAAGAPLLLSEPTCMPRSVRAVLDRSSADSLVLLGGPASVSDSVRTRVC